MPFVAAVYPIIIILLAALEERKRRNVTEDTTSLSQSLRFLSADTSHSGSSLSSFSHDSNLPELDSIVSSTISGTFSINNLEPEICNASSNRRISDCRIYTTSTTVARLPAIAVNPFGVRITHCPWSGIYRYPFQKDSGSLNGPSIHQR
ncbi:hypothetical protein K435DRAFT_849147 [Dendrothele bispora CBS 962.96]|uniref:Uncharacterized protein n=1 Tax=Dendrothele bispora (strain CBS 962.96) TaxID=1314807 RepID=A0A4S8MTL1_DENBC|nr:hypothetical protein K435DRAFT_849147 [Dendrothele bispora CBS 962.96]